MSRFRGSDEALDREIAVVETIARVRLRRASAEMQELARDLRELQRERARRRAAVGTPVEAMDAVPAEEGVRAA